MPVPPLEVCVTGVMVNTPVAVSSAGNPVVMVVPPSLTTGSPTTEAVSVSPMSWSLTAKVPVIAIRFCAAESPATSSTAVGLVVSASTVPSLVLTPRKSASRSSCLPISLMTSSGVVLPLTSAYTKVTSRVTPGTSRSTGSVACAYQTPLGVAVVPPHVRSTLPRSPTRSILS